MRCSFKKTLCIITAALMCVTAGCGSNKNINENSNFLEKSEMLYMTNIDLQTGFSKNEAADVSRTIAEDGTVLLKNENSALPLNSNDKIALFGSRQLRDKTYSDYGYYLGGAGSGAMYASPDVTPLEAIIAKSEEGKFEFYKEISSKYVLDPENYVPTADDINAAKNAGVNKAVYIISRFSGEAGTEESGRGLIAEPDNAMRKGEWYLSDDEILMLKTLKNNFDNVIVILNIGSLIDTDWIINGIDGEQVADTVLISWYGGLEGPEALANVLSGDANPSGKLTQTAANINAYPSTEDFYKAEYTNYTEDIFVGYRYFETFDPEYKNVNFEFGYGSSYTTFSISDINYSNTGKSATVSAKVTNTGNIAGKETLQVYYSAPQMGTGEAVLSKAAKELAGFAKTKKLAPGESETLSITFDINDMASYDDTGKTAAKSAYVLEKGDYKIYIGNSIKNVTEAGIYTVNEFTVTEQLSAHCVPYDLSSRLLADGTYEQLEIREHTEKTNSVYKNDEQADAPVVYSTGTVTYNDVLTGKNSLDELVAQMTIKELISFNARTISANSAQKSGVGANETATETFGIPVGDTYDGPVGMTVGLHANMYGFPCATMLACTWDSSLAADFGAVMGKFAQYDTRCHYWLAPSMNIIRNPLAGRNFEQYSEDPLISGVFASAITENAQYYGLACCVKHFAVNNKETARSSNDSRISERALREIYLKGFEMLVKDVKPNTIMSAYNKVNGTWCSENSELLMEIARNEWGFDGMYMTDWGGYHDVIKGFLSGMNIRMGGSAKVEYLLFENAYKNGTISRELLEENAKYVISSLMKINFVDKTQQ